MYPLFTELYAEIADYVTKPGQEVYQYLVETKSGKRIK